MMNSQTYEQIIVSGIKDLPPEMLREVADFVYFLRYRAVNPNIFEEKQFRALLEQDLSELNENELEHLEAEFTDYENIR